MPPAGPDLRTRETLAGVSLEYPEPDLVRTRSEDAGDLAARLPGTWRLLEDGIGGGLFPGAQLSVTLRGETYAQGALGAARAGHAMSQATLLCWFCCEKPIIAFAFGQLWERGLVDVDDPVCKVIPEFGTRGKERITFRHVLTHTAAVWPDPVWEVREEPRPIVLEAIFRAALPPDLVVGRSVAYGRYWAWTILGEAIRRLTGREYDDHVARSVLDTASRGDLWLRMPPADVARQVDRVGVMFDLDGPEPRAWPRRSRLDRYDRHPPGSSMVATAAAVARVYAAMSEGRVTSHATAAALTAKHRVGLADKEFGGYVSFGLGMVSDGAYFGSHCSPRTWGHKGLKSSCVLVDPEHGLVLAFAVNGLVAGPRSDVRDRAITDAVYRDLGLGQDLPPSPRITAVRHAAYGQTDD